MARRNGIRPAATGGPLRTAWLGEAWILSEPRCPTSVGMFTNGGSQEHPTVLFKGPREGASTYHGFEEPCIVYSVVCSIYYILDTAIIVLYTILYMFLWSFRPLANLMSDAASFRRAVAIPTAQADSN